MSLDLYQELTGLIAALDRHEIEYAVVGALALALHGAPRATTDIDLLIQPDSATAAVAAAKDLGFLFEALPIRFSDGMELRRVTKIEEAEPHETLTLDLLLVDHNLEQVWSSRRRLESELGAIWVISRDALIRMKTWAGRERDIADIRRLEDLDR
jgi:Nucleotidyltransferase of unknown function (DUF6036)